MVYLTAPFSTILNDPNVVFKTTPFFNAKYLTNGYRYGHSYYRRRIGNRTQAFEWHQFQGHAIFSDLELPISNPDFKVTQIFDVEYGINGTK